MLKSYTRKNTKLLGAILDVLLEIMMMIFDKMR